MAKSFRQLTEELYLDESSVELNEGITHLAVAKGTGKIMGTADSEKWARAVGAMTNAYADKKVDFEVVKLKKPLQVKSEKDYDTIVGSNISKFKDHL